MVLTSILVHFFHIWVLIGVKMLLFFGVDNNSLVHTNNKKKDILILGEALTQRLHDTTKQQKLNILLIFQDWNEILFKSAI